MERFHRMFYPKDWRPGMITPNIQSRIKALEIDLGLLLVNETIAEPQKDGAQEQVQKGEQASNQRGKKKNARMETALSTPNLGDNPTTNKTETAGLESMAAVEKEIDSMLEEMETKQEQDIERKAKLQGDAAE